MLSGVHVGTFILQEQCKDEIMEKMLHIQSEDNNVKFDDTNKKLGDEIRQLRWKLACRNQLCMDLSNILYQMNQENLK